eukprot:bmy_15872T0
MAVSRGKDQNGSQMIVGQQVAEEESLPSSRGTPTPWLMLGYSKNPFLPNSLFMTAEVSDPMTPFTLPGRAFGTVMMIFLRRIGLLLYSVNDPFPLTIPRWRWGMRILQGKSSLSLSNNPRPGGSTKILSWAQRTWTTTATSVTLIMGRSSFWTLWSPKSPLRPCWRTLPIIYILQGAS